MGTSTSPSEATPLTPKVSSVPLSAPFSSACWSPSSSSSPWSTSSPVWLGLGRWRLGPKSLNLFGTAGQVGIWSCEVRRIRFCVEVAVCEGGSYSQPTWGTKPASATAGTNSTLQVTGTDAYLHVTCTDQDEKGTFRKTTAVEMLRFLSGISKGFFFIFNYMWLRERSCCAFTRPLPLLPSCSSTTTVLSSPSRTRLNPVTKLI